MQNKSDVSKNTLKHFQWALSKLFLKLRAWVYMIKIFDVYDVFLEL